MIYTFYSTDDAVWASHQELTCHLPEAADEEGLVVIHVERDAVTQRLVLGVFDAVFGIGVGHTEQVLLQELGAAQHRAIIGERRHEPADIRLGIFIRRSAY